MQAHPSELQRIIVFKRKRKRTHEFQICNDLNNHVLTAKATFDIYLSTNADKMTPL